MNPTRRRRGWGTDRLAIRQVGCALLLALTLGTIFNAVHLLHDYLQERRRIATVGQSVLGLVSAPAARAAFTLDHELAATVTRTLLEVPFVVRANLDDNVRRPLAQARRERAERPLRWLTNRLFGEHLTRRVSFDRAGRLLAEAETVGWAVGTLEVEFDTRLLAQDFLSRSWVSIATGTARTILLGAVLAVVTHLMITRPLERLVATVEAVDPGAPARRPVRAGRGHERDELGRLARTIDGLLERVVGAQAQRRAAEAELRQAEKLKAVGTLASGVAHDFNNILATIFTSTEVALAQLPNGAAPRAALERVLNAGKRGRDLVSQILTFSRGERAPWLAIDLVVAVEAAVDLCRPALGERVELRLRRPAEPVFVAAGETQIVQLVSNLCVNAAQAMPGGGRLTVSVEGTGGDDPGWAKLRVQDTGRGMDAATAARAFEPFFTTKPVGQGTGLGLAVVHGIVEALGGRVELKSTPGRGTVVAVSLPCVGCAPVGELPLIVAPPPGAGRPVLQVGPDDGVGEAIARMLRGAGYRVARFADPADALESLAHPARSSGLLVAELAMPGLSGLELAEALRGRAPALPVILLADAAATADQLAGAAALRAVVLRKPVLRRELDAALARLLAPAGLPPGSRAPA